ncbi:unnamed protein product [Rotaria socialis]|uniref:Uncharacterized protein n=1 Tax=Rotaria socialis TaxID=392032 RepID=A0A817UNK8_9BILA|nr:unnamed protein product [Rotaria socialis]CAF4832929.1 unnamed protein product [Rotaria socialis]
MTRIGEYGRSAPLIERGRNRMAQHRDCRLGAARPRFVLARQISPLFYWRCGVWCCLAGTKRVCGEPGSATSPSACHRHGPVVGSIAQHSRPGHPEPVQSEARPKSVSVNVGSH